MPSGANTKLFRPFDKIDCRNLLNLNVEAKYVGFIGTLLSYQGIDILIDAAPKILKKEPRTIFFIIGEGPMKTIWKQRTEKIGLNEAFVFLGQIDYENVPRWIGAMDICVAPFLREAGLRSPVKIFDYMACGRPVVASKIPGTTDIFAGSGAIKLVKPQKSELLADAIIELIGSEKNAGSMGQKGRLLVVRKYDRRSLAQKISDEARAFFPKKNFLSKLEKVDE
jgi:glycosyltransferase involved in cell wall biosynthesis